MKVQRYDLSGVAVVSNKLCHLISIASISYHVTDVLNMYKV